MEEGRDVRMQCGLKWTSGNGVVEYRSIEIGIGRVICREGAEEWVMGFEDVREKAKVVMEVLDEDVEREVVMEELVERGEVLKEKLYEVGEELRGIFQIDERQ